MTSPVGTIPYAPLTDLRCLSLMRNYPRLDTCCLKLVSVINIFFWVICTALHTSILVAFSDYHLSSLDSIGWGIWGGLIYGITGILGLTGAAQRSRSHLITTIAFAMLSMASAVASCMLCIMVTQSLNCHNRPGFPIHERQCNLWFALEWSMFTLNFVGFFLNLTVFVVTSKGICTCCGCCCYSDSEDRVPILSSVHQQYSATSSVAPETSRTASTNQRSTNSDPPSYYQATYGDASPGQACGISNSAGTERQSSTQVPKP